MRLTGRAGRAIGVPAALLLLAGAAGAQGAKPLAKCAPDAVASGSVCVDRYEASVWRLSDPTGLDLALVKKIQQGKVGLDDLLLAGASQLGALDNYAPCPDSGQSCDDDSKTNNIFAVSLAGVNPSAHITWFQAQQACKNSRKRLPTSAEWQAAVAGTPDDADDAVRTCNTASATVVPTGSREACVSSDGAFDMVGNLEEWVADSVPLSEPPSVAPCGSWSTGDQQCLNGERVTTSQPGVLLRGGSSTDGAGAGPLAITDATPSPSTTTTTTTPATTTTSTTTTTAPPTTTTSTTTTTTTSPPTSTTTTTLPFVDVGFRCVR